MTTPLPDQGPRDRISTDLSTNLLVEAGAGSGKTTELVHRILALVRTGAAEIEEVAAVTFTRKAAAELQERLRDELEEALQDPAAEADEEARLDRALREVDRAFIGTIHAFCARLLRERPLEAGLDPGFSEVSGVEEGRLASRFWALHLERLGAGEDPAGHIDALRRVGLLPSDLRGLFDAVWREPDVDFPAPEVAAPSQEEVGRVRAELEEVMERADRHLPRKEPEKGWGGLQSELRELWYHRRNRAWNEDRIFLEVLGRFCTSSHKATQNRWSDDPEVKKDVKALAARCGELHGPGSAATVVLERWWAHRYPVAIRFAVDAARAFEEHRLRTGRLTFQDLLLRTRDLLLRDPGAREALGRRYARLLVDEFQDTDPVQAELLLLLASDPGTDPPEDPDVALWRRVRPRDGALFVVGDPKQSIYRFRRADISIYKEVRERFGDFGDVLRLTSNFRSRPPVARIVNDVFSGSGGFPDDATERQAPFAEMVPGRVDVPPREGVFHYDVSASSFGKEKVAAADAPRLAAWIASRCGDGGGRSPGDFLILTPEKKGLAEYGRALEAWGIPAQVTGSGVGVEEELRELLLVLDALADPDDPVRTVAALLGLFFGLDHEMLARHRERGGNFDLRAPETDGEPEVLTALTALHRWWEWAREEPADVVVGRLVRELGLLPYAAAGELGEERAGSLLFALESLRRAGIEGDTSLIAGRDALEEALDSDEVEAPLQPDRSGAVRVMNLHKAKGLEAPVVILAAPYQPAQHDPSHRVERREDGRALGWLPVHDPHSRRSGDILARPLEWPEKAEEERDFEAAEDLRLLYVATTRAGDELVVARNRDWDDRSAWSLLHPWLDEHGDRLDLEARQPPERDRLERSTGEIVDEVEAVERERSSRARPGYRFASVTARVKGEADAADQASPSRESVSSGRRSNARPDPGTGDSGSGGEEGPSGRAWGTAIHTLLEAAARGIAGDRLRGLARSVLLEQELPIDPATGGPRHLDDALHLIEQVRASDVWRRAARSPERLAERGFALTLDDGSAGDAGGAADIVEGVVDIVEGVLDLAFRENGGWVLVDYKTDRILSDERLAIYRNQLELYGRCWTELTGQPVNERILFHVPEGREIPC